MGLYSDEDISCVENTGKEDKVRVTHAVVLLELFSEGNTFDTTYEWWGYNAGCFKAHAFFLSNEFESVKMVKIKKEENKLVYIPVPFVSLTCCVPRACSFVR